MVRIFLVEDNAVMRAQLRTELEKPRGWTVVGEAEDGRRAIETWDDHAPNVTVMDFVMPEMDGLEATKIMKERYPAGPVIIAMTANALSTDLKICMDAGMDDYISKPVKLESLVGKLRQWALQGRENKPA